MSSPSFLHERIRELCAKALVAPDPEWEEPLRQLRGLLPNTRTACGSSRQKNWGAHQIQADPVGESYTRLRSAQGSSAGFGDPEQGH